MKLRGRLLGPLVSVATTTPRRTLNHNPVDGAFHEIDTALDHISVALRFKQAA